MHFVRIHPETGHHIGQYICISQSIGWAGVSFGTE